MTDEVVLSGTWKEFEAWIREQVGSSFVWKIRPLGHLWPILVTSFQILIG